MSILEKLLFSAFFLGWTSFLCLAPPRWYMWMFEISPGWGWRDWNLMYRLTFRDDDTLRKPAVVTLYVAIVLFVWTVD